MTSLANPPADTWLTDNLPDVGELVGAAEIQVLLGVGRQRVQQLANLDDFPAPVAVLKAGKIWRTADIVEWARARGREIQDDN